MRASQEGTAGQPFDYRQRWRSRTASGSPARTRPVPHRAVLPGAGWPASPRVRRSHELRPVAAFAFAPGLAIGRFLNVVVERCPCGGRSSAPRGRMNCRTRARVLTTTYRSSVASCCAGGCRTAFPLSGHRTAARYPAVEIGTAWLSSRLILEVGLSGSAFVAPSSACLVAVSGTDIDTLHPEQDRPAAAVIVLAATRRSPSPSGRLARSAHGFLFAAASPIRGGWARRMKLAILMAPRSGAPLPGA